MADQKMLKLMAGFIHQDLKTDPLNASFEERLREAMRFARDWDAVSIRDEDTRFQAGIVSALIGADEETTERIKAELDGLAMLSAATDGIPVDFSAVSLPEDPIGLIPIWREIKEEARAEQAGGRYYWEPRE